MMNTNTNKVTINRRTVMREANALCKGGMKRGDAVRQGHKLAKLYAIFALGLAANITFTKADGTVRNANVLPAKVGEYLINGNGTHTTPKANLLFVDTALGEFRSFVKARLLTVNA